MNKKGMGIQQVFIFMVAAITFSFIIIFGYSAITDFLEKGETVEFFQFKNDIESSVKKIYSEYGAVRIQEFRVPSDYQQICLVDLDYLATAAEIESLCIKDPIACDVWQSAQPVDGSTQDSGYDSVDANVFLKPSAPVVLKVFKLEISDGYLCKNIENGRFTLRMEGRGSRTLVS